jgi:hypothetical protein
MRLFNRKTAAVAAGMALVVVTGAVAFGYWTSGGSGSGQATTGTNAAITVNQTSVLTAMYPGDTAQTLSGDFSNGNTSPAYVGTVTASISSVVKAVGAPAGTCDASDFTLSNAAMSVNAEVPSGTHQGSWSGATIKFNDKPAANQDACKGATVNLSYQIS